LAEWNGLRSDERENTAFPIAVDDVAGQCEDQERIEISRNERKIECAGESRGRVNQWCFRKKRAKNPASRGAVERREALPAAQCESLREQCGVAVTDNGGGQCR
jgi:hypothetical protein